MMNVFYDSKFLMTSGRNFLFLTFCLAKVVTPLVTEEVEAVSELAPAPTYCCGLGTVYWIGDIPCNCSHFKLIKDSKLTSLSP